MDFLITSSGDLAFTEEDSSSSRLNVTFFKSKAKPLRVSFAVEACEESEPSENTLTLMFNLSEIKNNKRVPLVSDNMFLIQQITMRLKTSLGELALRSGIGSTIETVMHKDITDVNVQTKIKKIVINTIGDLMVDPVIKVKPVVKKNNGYKQCMEIYIYEGNTLLTSQEMEW